MVFAAGVLRGFTGFGFSLCAVPLLSLVMAPAQAVPLVLILQCAVSINGLRPALRECDWRSVRLLALGAVVPTPAGLYLLSFLPAAPVRLVIAAVVVFAVVVLGRGARLPITPGPAAVVGFGLATGLCNGLTGIPGPPVIAFYLAAPIGTAAGRASMIVLFMATSIAGLIPLIATGHLPQNSLVQAVFTVPSVYIGSRIGAYLYRRSPEAHYRTVAMALLVLTAILAAWRAAADII